MKEMVTLQVGEFANYIGSHFWNFQDEFLGLAEDLHGNPIFKNPYLDMDVLYRTGETQQGVIWPTLLHSKNFLASHEALTELPQRSGSLGCLSSSGSLYNEAQSSDTSHVVTWNGNVSRHTAEPHKKNLFLLSLEEDEHRMFPISSNTGRQEDDSQSVIKDNDRVECLQSGVEYWTDYSKVQYHPKSLYEFNGLWTDIQEFDNYGIGRDVLVSSSQSEEMNERLRFFVEDCDNIQGIQFIVDDSGGFSGVAADFLEYIADEYTNMPVLLYAVRGPSTHLPTTNRKKSILRALHDSVSLSKLSSFCKLMVPVGLPALSESKAASFLHMEEDKPFHYSAVYAAALSSLVLPFRMISLGSSSSLNYISGAVDVGGLAHMLADQARQNPVAILDVAMPAPPLTGAQRERSFPGSLHSLTPEVTEHTEDIHQVESMVIQGALHQGGQWASISEVKDSVNGAYETSITKPRFLHLSVAITPLPIPLPFPSIFGSHVGQHGELLQTPVPSSQWGRSLDVHSIPMAARLRSSTAILPYVENRLENLKKFGIDRGAPGSEVLRSWGFQREDVEEMRDFLSKMAMALSPHSDFSSDSD